MTRKQCYVLLGIAEGTTLEEVKRAYRKRAFELHPDLNPAPNAGKKFQELNEAYVLILGFIEQDRTFTTRSTKQSGKAEGKPASEAKAQQPKAAAGRESRPGGAPEGGKAGFARPSATAEGKPEYAHSETRRPAAAGAGNSAGGGMFFKHGDSYTKLSQEEVLSSVLRDPFARRVFEDIYSEIRQGGKSTRGKSKKNGPGLTHILPLRGARGLVYSLKDWFRKQIDDEQTVSVPVQNLRPGMRIRLQVQQGISGKLQNIELTIPLDYTPGRPVRLKGLGRKIGPWLGDLYLRIVPKMV